MQSSDSGPALERPPIEPPARQLPLSLHQALRVATAAPHARLHLHDGFAAIQSGTIDLFDYRSLLVRLYGFHVAFELAADVVGGRSAWLAADLAALAISGPAPAAIPRCAALTAFDTPARRLGALYVVEGSALGGRQLARNLDSLLGPGANAGRNFFLGGGVKTNAAWNAFLERLTLLGSSPSVEREIVAAAVATFEIFEQWMRDWRNFKV